MSDLVFGVKFTADGKQFVGEAKITRESLDGLTEATKRTKSEAERLRDEHQRGGAQMGQYSTAAQTLSAAVKTLAASYAVLKVVQYAKEAALLSARYETLGVSMRVVGNNAGYTSAEMEAAAVGMQKTGISMVESRQQALRLVQANIDLSQSSKLARIAQDAAVIGNVNSSEAFSKMIQGIQTGQSDVLRSIGLNISLERSYADYAASLGKSTDAMTVADKTQATLNAVMKEGEVIAGTYEAAMGTAGKQLNSMKRYTEDLQLKIGEVFDESLVVGVMAFTAELKDANGQISELSQKNQLKQWGEDLTDTFAALADNVGNAVGALKLLSLLTGGALAKAASPFMGSGANAALEVAAYRKSVSEDISAQYAAIMDGEDKYTKALTARRAARKADDAEHREQVSAFAEYEKQVMLTSAVTTAKERNTILMAASKSLGVEYANKLPARAEVINKDAEAYAKIKKSADDYIASLARETEAIGKNVYEKKYLEAATKMQAAATQEQRDAIMQGFSTWSEATQIEEANTAAKKANEEATKAATKAAEEMNKAYFDNLDALNQSTASIVDDTQKLRDQNIELTYGKDALERVKEARAQATLVTLQATLAGIDETNQTSAQAEAIRGKIAALEDYAAAQGANVIAKQVDEEGKLRTEMWKKVDDVARDTFVNIWGHGKSTLDRLRDTLKNGLLAMLYEMGKRQFLISVGITGGGVGASGMAHAAGGAGDIGSMVSGAQSIWNAGSAAVSSLFAPAATGMAAFTSAQMSGAVMASTYTAPAIATLGAEAGAAASGLGALGSAAMTAMPYIAAAVLVYSLLKGNKSISSANTGDVHQYYADGVFAGQGSVTGSNAALDANAASLQASYMQAAMALGITATTTHFGINTNTGAQGQNPNTMFWGEGGRNADSTYRSSYYSGEVSTADTAAMQLAASRAVFAALQGSELPGYLAHVFDGLTASAMTQQGINDTLAFGQALTQMRGALLETRTPLEVLRANVNAGTVAFATSAATFRTDFVAAIDAGINPQVFEQWKALGTAIDQLAAADADIAAQNTETLARAAEDAVRYQTTMLDLQGKISELNGNELMVTAVLIEQRRIAIAELNASDPTGYLAALTNQLWGLQDAANDAAAAAELEHAAGSAMQTARQQALQTAQSTYETAKSGLLESYNRESQAAQQLADKMRGFASSFSALRNSLNLGNLSPLSGIEKYQEAQRQFDDVSRRAQLGDTEAMAQLDGVSQSFLQASRDYNASSAAYAADFQRVSYALQSSGDVATRQADIATSQVTLLQGQLSALGLINTSVLSVVDAMAAFAVASAAVAGPPPASVSVSSSLGSSGSPENNSAYNHPSGVAANDADTALLTAAKLVYQSATGGVSTAQFNAAAAAVGGDIFAATGWNGDPESFRQIHGFASGGDHAGGLRIVGERGWEMEATGASRIFNHDQAKQILSGGDNSALIAELKALRAEVAKLREENAKQADKVAGAVGDAADANTLDLRGLKQSLAHGIGKLAA